MEAKEDTSPNYYNSKSPRTNYTKPDQLPINKNFLMQQYQKHSTNGTDGPEVSNIQKSLQQFNQQKGMIPQSSQHHAQ